MRVSISFFFHTKYVDGVLFTFRFDAVLFSIFGPSLTAHTRDARSNPHTEIEFRKLIKWNWNTEKATRNYFVFRLVTQSTYNWKRRKNEESICCCCCCYGGFFLRYSSSHEWVGVCWRCGVRAWTIFSLPRCLFWLCCGHDNMIRRPVCHANDDISSQWQPRFQHACASHILDIWQWNIAFNNNKDENHFTTPKSFGRVPSTLAASFRRTQLRAM